MTFDQTILPEQLEDRLLMSELILKLTLIAMPPTTTHPENFLSKRLSINSLIHFYKRCVLIQSTVQYSTVQYSMVWYSTVYYSTVQYNTEQCGTVQYSTLQYSMVQYSSHSQELISVLHFQSRKRLQNCKCPSLVSPSVRHRNPSASQNRSYRPSSLSTIEPINH